MSWYADPMLVSVLFRGSMPVAVRSESITSWQPASFWNWLCLTGCVLRPWVRVYDRATPPTSTHAINTKIAESAATVDAGTTPSGTALRASALRASGASVGVGVVVLVARPGDAGAAHGAPPGSVGNPAVVFAVGVAVAPGVVVIASVAAVVVADGELELGSVLEAIVARCAVRV